MGDYTTNELWNQFLVKLRTSGTDIEDIKDCTSSVLQSLILELGFSALQAARLQTEWSRRRPQPAGSQRFPVSEHSSEFQEVASGAQHFFAPLKQQGHQFHILGVERVVNSSFQAAFEQRRMELRNSTAPTVKKWKLLALDDIDATCSNGFPIQADQRTGCGVAFAGEADNSVARNAAHGKLVLAEVAVGNQKMMLETEASHIFGNKQMGEIQQGLHHEGFDSLAVRCRPPLSDVVSVYHPAQAIPRYFVTFSMQAAPALTHQMGVSRVPVFACRDHPGKEVEFWCVDEARLVCSHCMFLHGYNQKRCVVLSEGASIERENVRRWIDAGEGFVKELGRVLLSFDAAIEGVESESQRQIQTMQRRVDDIRSALENMSQEISQRIHEESRNQIAALQKNLSQVVGLVSNVEDVIGKARGSLSSGSDVELLAARDAITARWDPVHVPAYEVPAVFVDEQQVQTVLRHAFALRAQNGPVVLPETIDANHILPLRPGMK